MGTWKLAIALDAQAAQPLFLQIARGIADGVKRGSLRPGDKLPGTRALAATLGVHRNTAIAAYDELCAEGWVVSRATGGTFVSMDLPDIKPKPFATATVPRAPRNAMGQAGFDLTMPLVEGRTFGHAPGILQLAATDADLRLVPIEALARAYRRALMSDGVRLLDAGDPRGHLRLRTSLAGMLGTTRGLAATPDGMIVTRGSQMALFLVARALIRPGDVVAIEALGYRPAWEAFAAAGARLEPLPVDAHGLVVDALPALLARTPVRAIYLTPHHHYPTTVTLSPGRRLQLLAIAAAHRIAIVEDDYDNEFHYEGRPILPLASADPAAVVIYVGTLSKILAPGLRLGFVAAPPPVIEALAALRRAVDGQGDHAVECAVAELLGDREVQRHAHRMRRAYLERRDALMSALERHLSGSMTFQPPAGGMSLWAQVDESIDLPGWIARGLESGVAFGRSRRFAFEGAEPHALRLGFAALTPDELEAAVRRMAVALTRRRKGTATR